jgi:hypothetical protein
MAGLETKAAKKAPSNQAICICTIPLIRVRPDRQNSPALSGGEAKMERLLATPFLITLRSCSSPTTIGGYFLRGGSDAMASESR